MKPKQPSIRNSTLNLPASSSPRPSAAVSPQDAARSTAKAAKPKTVFDKAKAWTVGLSGVLVVLPALVNSGYDVYAALAKIPRTETQKINNELFQKYFNKQPVWSFPIPVKRDAGSVEAKFFVYEGGDVYIEFGKRSQWFPFPLLEKTSFERTNSFIGTALADQPSRVGSGTFEQSDRIDGGTITRERRWENGVLEVFTLDSRTGNILNRKLSNWEGSVRASSSAVGDQARWLAALDKETFGSVPLYRFSDSAVYAILTPIEWHPNSTTVTLPRVLVPRNFVSDLSSVPRVFWSVFRPEPQFIYAAFIHDYLYWDQRTSREVADRIFREVLSDLNTPNMQIDLLYSAVRSFGQTAWDANAKAKLAGEKRVVARLPDKTHTTWQEWRSRPEAFTLP